jgi:nitronate monooxygenase
MAIETRLTERFGLTCPIIGAPMARAGGGRLAAAISEAGGLGLIGGGYSDPEWVRTELDQAGDARVGIGFITWALEAQPALLEEVLQREPVAIMLSFGDPRPLGARVREAGVPLICQVNNRADTLLAIEAEADVIVAQGGEAGGHGEHRRGTFTLVPELADVIARRTPESLVCAAGGIADGRGLAAALMLGADGVLIGTRLWATDEALVAPGLHAAAIRADGDATTLTTAQDIALSLSWPPGYPCRVLRNDFTDTWEGRAEELRATGGAIGEQWKQAYAAGDADRTTTIVGEAAGLIDSIAPAGAVIERIVQEAARLLAANAAR